MSLLMIIGYALAILIGLSLGIIGSGGSILTVPILVYVMGKSAELSTAYSLFIVGLTALVGAGSFMSKKLVNYKVAVIFAVPSFIAVYLTRMFIIPNLPEVFFSVGTFELTKRMFIMGLFALLMIFSSISMIRDKRRETDGDSELKFNYPMIFLEGLVVGTLTGLVGAGGGFLIIPALVLFAGLPMKMAVGTSLLIIAAKSLIGFLGDIQNENLTIEWSFLLLFAVFTIGGILLGTYLSRFIPGQKLKPAFGWFVLVMGGYIMVKEFIFV